MSKIAFLGLGNMGTPMTTRLLNAGHDVIVWNRSARRTAPLAQAGASVAASLADAATGVEFAITMLATPEALDHVLFGRSSRCSATLTGRGFRSRRPRWHSAFDPIAVKVTTKNSIIPRTDRSVIASCGRR